MAVLKDFECSGCGRRREAMAYRDTEQDNLPCESCGRLTVHDSICNAGKNSRYRFMDWSGYDGRGKDEAAVQVLETVAEEYDAEGNLQQVASVDGRELTHKGEEIEERREKIDYRRRREAGSAPIVVDQTRG